MKFRLHNIFFLCPSKLTIKLPNITNKIFLPPGKQYIFLTKFPRSLKASSQRQTVHRGGHLKTCFHNYNFVAEDKVQAEEEGLLLLYHFATDHGQNPLYPDYLHFGWQAILPEKITSCHKTNWKIKST